MVRARVMGIDPDFPGRVELAALGSVRLISSLVLRHGHSTVNPRYPASAMSSQIRR